ncbi:MAG: hypothetical protein C0483_17465 [Pirellula sp.]|nr:hypothetical protein [Pirellula sp.]
MPIKTVLKAAIPQAVRQSIRNLLNSCTPHRSPAWPLSRCVSHLDGYLEAEAMGPIQQSEALLLFAMARVTQPQVLVEFGFNQGDSAANFLRALPPSSAVHSYDISEMSRTLALKLKDRHPNFHYHHKSQIDFVPTDVADRSVNFVFIDAAHDLHINQATWRAVEPALAADAIIAVHDTGTWHRQHFLPIHETMSKENPERWLNSNEYQHQIGERQFVNWIVASTNFVALHFHASSVLRHGLTILQNKCLLPITTNEVR